MKRKGNNRSNVATGEKGGSKGNRSTTRPPNPITTAWQPPSGDIPNMIQTWNLSRVHPDICQYMNQNHQVYKGHINAMDIVMGANTEIDALPKLKEYINDNGGSKYALTGV